MAERRYVVVECSPEEEQILIGSIQTGVTSDLDTHLQFGSMIVVSKDRRDIVVEHATMYKGGDMHVRNAEPEVEAIYPLEKWLENTKRHGKVYRRSVLVLDDWEEV